MPIRSRKLPRIVVSRAVNRSDSAAWPCFRMSKIGCARNVATNQAAPSANCTRRIVHDGCLIFNALLHQLRRPQSAALQTSMWPHRQRSRRSSCSAQCSSLQRAKPILRKITSAQALLPSGSVCQRLCGLTNPNRKHATRNYAARSQL